jgi:hypothetical protein
MPEFIIPFTIKKGTSLTKCILYQNDGPRPCLNKNKLLSDYTGELVYNIQSSGAKFYKPSKNDCTGQEIRFNCNYVFSLSNATLNKIKPPKESSRTNPENDAGSNVLGRQSPSQQRSENRVSQEASKEQIQTEIKSPVNIETYALYLTGAALLTIVAYLVFVLYKWIQRPHQTSRQFKSTNSQSDIDPRTLSIQIAEEVFKQLSPIDKKLNSLSSKVDQLQTELISLSQTAQSSGLKSLTGFTEPATSRIPASIQSSVPTPIRLPLSESLIKEALLTQNYNLISIHPHEFVSETDDSRQGLQDKKQFVIEGDQGHSTSRAQSEFIAILCSGVTYLIPNLLPNSSDPARTIKRHADRNNIYQSGSGSNYLKLQDLAVVEKKGKYYELKKLGLVS